MTDRDQPDCPTDLRTDYWYASIGRRIAGPAPDARRVPHCRPHVPHCTRQVPRFAL